MKGSRLKAGSALHGKKRANSKCGLERGPISVDDREASVVTASLEQTASPRASLRFRSLSQKDVTTHAVPVLGCEMSC